MMGGPPRLECPCGWEYTLEELVAEYLEENGRLPTVRDVEDALSSERDRHSISGGGHSPSRYGEHVSEGWISTVAEGGSK